MDLLSVTHVMIAAIRSGDIAAFRKAVIAWLADTGLTDAEHKQFKQLLEERDLTESERKPA